MSVFGAIPDEILERILLAAGVSHARAVCRRWRGVLARYRPRTPLVEIANSPGLAHYYCANDAALRSRICDAAAAVGNFRVLQWAHSNDCPLGARACDLAAAGGRVDMLQWL